MKDWEYALMVRALGLPKGGRILEVGCGPGHGVCALHRLLSPSRLVGLDIDDGALTDAEVVLFPSSAEGVAALERGEIAAYSADQVVLMGLAMTSAAGEKFAIASEVFSFEPFALAVRRNDADFRLVADSVLSHLYRTGLILEIYDRWFGRFAKKRPRIFETLYQLNATPE